MTKNKHPQARSRRWRSGRVLLVVGVLAALSFATATPASAATSSTLLYSTDGGTTWSSTVTAPAGGTVLVRQWYNNTGNASETAASLRTTVPAGFTLQGGSTKICLNPSTTNFSSPSSTEQKCAASTESSVWSGSDLQISPSAGFYGDSNGATSGTTAYGRKRYLNLHQCLYDATSNKLSEFTAVSTNAAFQAGTNASNTADTARVCGAGGGGYTFDSGISGVEALDLLGNRYLNLHQCVYFNSANNDLMTTAIPKGVAAFQAPTNTSNTADTTESCPNTAAGIASGWQQTSVQSGLAAYDLRANRYLNVHQCVWNNSAAADAFTVIASNGNTPTGTNASNTADTTRVCGTKSGWSLSTTHSGVAPYDLLDTARGAGYVQYALTAPATPSPAACASTPFSGTEAFTQSGTYQSAETSAASSTGNLTVDFSALADPCPTNPIPSVDPVIGGAILATAGAGYLLYRQRRVVAA